MICKRQDGDEVEVTQCCEGPWRDFLAGVMAHTVRLCAYLCQAAPASRAGAYRETLHRRLYSAAIAWRWVFDGVQSELPFEEVCLFLGVSEDRARSRILAASRPPADINDLVDRILEECRCEDGDPERKAKASGRVVSTDWARLRDFRSHHPLGASFEDFCRLAVAGGQDSVDGSGRRAC